MNILPAANPEPAQDLCFRNLVDTVKDVIFQTDVSGCWTFLNPAWEEITGYSIAESLGTQFLDYVHPEDRPGNIERFRHLLNRETGFCRHIVRYRARSGWRSVEIFAKLLFAPDGEVIGTTGRISDITEQQNIISTLRATEARLSAMLGSSPAVIYQSSAASAREFRFVSDNSLLRVGFPAAACLEPGFWAGRIHPDDAERVRQALAHVGSPRTCRVEYRFLHADGLYRWLLEEVEVTARDHRGRPEELTGCILDITERVEAVGARERGDAILGCVRQWAEDFLKADSWQPAIQPALSQLGTASQLAHVRLFRYLPQHFSAGLRFVLTSEWNRLEPHCGPSELEAGLSFWEPGLLAGQSVVSTVEALPELERAFLERDGCRLLALIPIIVDGALWGTLELGDTRPGDWFPAEIDALRAAANIIAASVQNEQARHTLRWREALLSAMAASSPLAFYVVDDRSGAVLYFNDRFCDLWGLQSVRQQLRAGELAHHDVMQHCLPRLADARAFATTVELLQSVANRAMLEDELEFADQRVIRHFSSQIRDPFDRYFGRLHLFEDVTERRRTAAELERRVTERTADLEHANRALEESQRSFRAIFDESPIGILVLDAQGLVLDANLSMQEMIEGSVTAGPPVAFSDLFDEPATTRAWNAVEDVIRGHHENCTVETRLRTLRGNTVWARISIAPLHPFNDGRRFALAMVQNVTKRRQLEDQVRHSQKMDALGRLAGGVAHDFNNLLTVIKGYTELLLKRLDPEHALYPKVGQIKRASDRAASLVQQLLAFSRKQVLEPKTIAVNTAVADMEKMLRRLIGEDIELVTVLGAEAGSVSIDPGQLEQVIVNLTVNARDAMEQGGTLIIETDRRRVVAEEAARNGLGAGNYVVLRVSDNGAGMSEEVVSRIFEPFFTTKPVGKGTGLGLSTVYGIVQQIDGQISVASEPGRGSTFTILLPAVEAIDRAPEPQPETAHAAPSGRETILVVEDEDLVRGMVCETLRDEGYTVLQAVDGAEAAAVLDALDTTIDLLLTDVVMPRMGGKDLARLVEERRPGIPLIFMSGYNEADWDPDRLLLRKPFTAETLSDRVRKALDAAPAA